MAEEALVCFQNLIASIPGWIADLEGLSHSVTDRQRQLLLEHQEAGHTPRTNPLRSLKRKISKSSSLSLADRHDAKRQSVELLRPQLPHLTDSDALRLSQRKRKTPSVASGTYSGPSKYRSESLIVIYYDGDAQKRLEKLVRSIASSRNDVRKGKLGAKVEMLARSGSSSSSDSAASDDEELSPSKFSLPYKRTTRTPLTPFSRNDGSAPFDRVDSLLEKSQALSERAAHQLLRDGDCNKEVTQILAHLRDALSASQTELPQMQKQAEKAARRRRRSLESQPQPEPTSITRAQLRQPSPIAFHAMPPGEMHLEVDALEVDSDDEGEMDGEIDLSSFALNKMLPVRRTGPPVMPPVTRAQLIQPSPIAFPAMPAGETHLEVDALEVDSDDEGEMDGEIDLSNFALNKMLPARRAGPPVMSRPLPTTRVIA